MSKIVPLHKDRHRDLKVEPALNVDAARSQHMLPLIAQEFVAASTEFPIVFVKHAETGQFQPVLLLGLQAGENLYLNAADWSSLFIPGCIRNQPFKLVQNDADREQLMVGVDEASIQLQTDRGERLFEDDGTESRYLQHRKQALVDYYDGEQVTRAFVGRLADAGLLTARSLVVEVQGDKAEIDGIYVIDEKRVNELPDTAFNELRRRGFLAPIYAHLISLQQVRHLSRRKEALSL
ncbi:SapC family protein [Exilibacterium tricleocarpae]|uniref:SapC family protein n=1 Tax=Exilibacterium tricleocarpae TaxID=2591008 RepID=A0A545TNW9_9GAMM|nr:SapC family protein [Exilibacterium tricleocarpae]TQV78920.1 SapC family protein [Exilibacterium tricleocarpae]